MEQTKKSQTEGKRMKQILDNALREMCHNASAKIDTEGGRDFIVEHLLKIFRDNHIVFYTNLEEAMKDPKMTSQMDIPCEKGL
jgi:hypothetical protein